MSTQTCRIALCCARLLQVCLARNPDAPDLQHLDIHSDSPDKSNPESVQELIIAISEFILRI